MEIARRASLIDEEASQLRAIEFVVGAFSSRVAEDERSTTDGVPTTEGRVLGNQTRQHVDRRHFATQVCFTYHPILYTLMHWGKLRVFV